MSTKVISFHYTLTGSDGGVIDSSDGHPPLSFLAGKSQIIPGLEEVIVTLDAGDKRTVEVKAADAYGLADPEKLFEVPIEKMPKQSIEVGDQFSTRGQSQPLTVTKVTDTHVTLDANHPLAGMDLTFAVEVTEIRDATEEEISHGHVHGPGGHGH